MKKQEKVGFLSVLKLSMRISFESSLFFSLLRILCSMANAILPTTKLLIMKYVIDALIEKSQSEVLMLVAFYVFAQMVSIVIEKLNSYSALMHSEKIGLQVSNTIIDKVGELDVSYFDNPALYDEMSIATRNGGAISNLFWSLISLIQGTIQLIVSFIIVSKVGILYAVILTLTSLPYFFVERNNEIQTYQWTRKNENKVRKINYLYRVFVDKYFAIDLRVNNLLTYMKKKYIIYWNTWFAGKKGLIKKQFIKSFFSVLLSNIVAMLFVVLMSYNVLFEKLSISEFTYYLGISTQLVNYTYIVLSGFSSFKQLKMKTKSYYTFMEWKPFLAADGRECVCEPFKSIRFEKVSFSYPNCQEEILHNVSFEMRAGEKVLLIGNNGSGKSTLIKLLLRLYEPTEGKIYLNEKPISEYSQEEYYKVFSLLPQNYVNYAFTIKENILCKDFDNDGDKKVMASIEKANLSSVIDHLPNGIETYLTKQFDIDGVEFSVGEWQKMAMARFFCKEAKFKILDEPSSSLDVFSQERTLSQMLDEKESTVLLASHRFIGMINICRVISLCGGTIVEDDTPQHLEKKNGFYALWKSASLNESRDCTLK